MNILLLLSLFAVSATTLDALKYNGEEAFVQNGRLFYKLSEKSPVVEVDPTQPDYFEQGVSELFNPYHEGYWWFGNANYLAYISVDTRLVKTVSWNRYGNRKPYPEIVEQRYFKTLDNFPPFQVSVWNTKTKSVKHIDFDHTRYKNGTNYFIYDISQITVNDKSKLLIVYTNYYWNEIIVVTCECETAKCQIHLDYEYAEKQFISLSATFSLIWENRLYLLLPLYFKKENNSYQQIASISLNETNFEPKFEMMKPYDVERISMFAPNIIDIEAFSRNPYIRNKLSLKIEPHELSECDDYCREISSHEFVRNGKVALENDFEGLYKLILPHHNSSHRVPLYVSVYGGPESVIEDGVEYNKFAKLFIDGRGSGRRGWKYRSASYGKLGIVDAQDQLTVIQHVLNKYSDILDKNRVLVAGWSYGGFMALAVAELAPKGFFKCAIAGAPVTNFLYHSNIYTRRYMGNATASEYVDLTDNLENFRTTRLLLLHGMADDNVHFQNSAILIEKLHKAEIDFDLMVFLILKILCEDETNRTDISIHNGAITFQVQEDKNITFSTFGKGSVFINDADLKQLPSQENYTITISSYSTAADELIYLKKQLLKLKSQAESVIDTANEIDQYSIKKKIREVKKYNLSDLDSEGRELQTLKNKISEIGKTIIQNPCTEKNVCLNGGTCIPKIGDQYQCLCSKYYTGKNCGDDIDECLFINGTDLECKNGGSCINTKNGYKCECKKGFHGPFCQFEQSVCSQSTKLCGPHGHCISTNPYSCKCDPGFQVIDEKTNPTCVDIDECENNPCGTGVQCLNLDGSFQCNGCPKGYKMIGGRCKDIDECKENPYPCATHASCTNLEGSYECGECPFGYSGNGQKRCTKNDPCSWNNCPMESKCVPNDHLLNSQYECLCPENQIYDETLRECLPHPIFCDYDKCVNGGTCLPTNDGHKCICKKDFIGDRCEMGSPCVSNPCKNGVCKIREDHTRVCICDVGFYGDKCEISEKENESHFTDDSGYSEMSFKYSNQTKVHRSYFAKDSQDYLIRITFIEFEIKNDGSESKKCVDSPSKLTFYNGPDQHHQVFAIFCSDFGGHFAPKLNQPITIANSQAMLEFRGKSGSYKISYEFVKRECGSTRTQPSGNLFVPENTQNISCLWMIRAPHDKIIELTVPNLKMHSGNNSICEQNCLEIYDGFYQEKTIGEHCSNIEQSYVYRSSGSYMTILFDSEMSPFSEKLSKISGFSLVYKFIDSPNSCGETFTSDKSITFGGIIKSPNFDYGNYPPNINCYWSIEYDGNPTHGIMTRFNVLYYDIPEEECLSDHFAFSVKNRMPHTDECETIQTNSSAIFGSEPTIHFVSDDSNQHRGFEIKFEVICWTFLDGYHGVVQSWNYPDGGKAGKCTYLMYAVPKTYIAIKFIDIRFPELYKHCNDSKNEIDYEPIIDFRDEDDIRQYDICANDLGEILIGKSISFKSGRLTIIVTSDGNPLFKGISFEYDIIKHDCNHIYMDDLRIVNSYLTSNSTISYCLFSNKKSERIKLRFDLTYMEYSEGKTCGGGSRIEVFEFDTSVDIDGESLGVFCDGMKPPKLFGKKSKMMIKHINFGESLANIKFEKVSKKTSCDETFTEPSGVIFAKGFFIKCLYHISVPPGNRIIFKVESMQISQNEELVEIWDGMEPGGIPLHEYTGLTDYSPLTVFTSSSHNAVIESQFRLHDSFFNISYKIRPGCGKTVNSISGALASPYYPGFSTHFTDCEWKIAVAQGNLIEIELSQLHLSERACDENSNRLEISDKHHNVLERFCEMPINKTKFVFETDELIVHYVEEEGYYSAGFMVLWTTICKNIELTEMSGYIQSPGYPNRNYQGASCSWTIKAPIGNKIDVIFHDFEIQRNGFGKCEGYEFLQITDGSANRTHCGTENPLRFTSHHNILQIAYFSTDSFPSNRFSLSWKFVGCVDEYNSPRIIEISSTDIDNAYNYFECQYRIKAPVGKQIKLRINSFDMRGNHQCQYKNDETFRGIAVFMGKSNISHTPQNMVCDNSKDGKEVISEINEMFIRISLERANFKSGTKTYFSASFDFIESTDACSKVIDLSHNNTYILNSSNYPACNWLFTTDEGNHFAVNLEKQNFGTLNIFRGRSEDVENNFIGNNAFEMSLQSVCGTNYYAIEEEQEMSFKMVGDGQTSCVFHILNRENDGSNVNFAFEKIDFLTSTEHSRSVGKISKYQDSGALWFGALISLPTKHFESNGITVELSTDAIIRVHFKYGKNMGECGGVITRRNSHINHKFNYEKEDCEWTIKATPGSHAIFEIDEYILPESPRCKESYLEVRETNSSGKLLSRQCKFGSDEKQFISEALYIRIRYRPQSEADVGKIVGSFEKYPGGLTESRVLVPVDYPLTRPFIFMIGDPAGKNGIKLHISDLYLSPDSWIKYSDYPSANMKHHNVATDGTIYLPYPETVISAKIKFGDDFRITWEPYELFEDLKILEMRWSNCGETNLEATWEWQNLESPNLSDENVNCLWNMKVPEHMKLVIQFTERNFTNCTTDFIEFYYEKFFYSDTPFQEHSFNGCNSTVEEIEPYGDVLIKFRRTNISSNFKLKYRIECGKYIRIPTGNYVEHTIINPPNVHVDKRCFWMIQFLSYRHARVEITELNIVKNQTCDRSNSLRVVPHEEGVFCGKLQDYDPEKLTFIAKHGRFWVEFNTEKDQQNSFKIVFGEYVGYCPSQNYRVDEYHSTFLIYSPEYPHDMPISMECEYHFEAPNGHKLMLSFEDFDLNSYSERNENFIEIHDGYSSNSPKIGRFIEHFPPSTILSTENFLYMRLRTSQDIPTHKFVAKIELAKCGGLIYVGENENVTEVLKLPKFKKNEWPISCNWTIRGLNSHLILYKIEHYTISKHSSLSITDKNETLSSTTSGDFMRSSSPEISIIFNITSPEFDFETVEKFKILLKLSDNQCGGKIENSSGQITLPGFPGKILPHLKCQWNLNAGIGFKYHLRLEFTDQTNFLISSEQLCFRDIKIHNFGNMNNYIHFCENSLEMVSATDISAISYDDFLTRQFLGDKTFKNISSFYSPFIIHYEKVPSTDDCSKLINQNQTFVFHNSNDSVLFQDVCHMVFKRPEDYYSTNIKIDIPGHDSENFMRSCIFASQQIRLKSFDPIHIDEEICDRSVRANQTDFTTINEIIDFVATRKNYYFNEEFTQFTVSVEFQKCGGYIRNSKNGTISSPNYGQYLSNSRCQWLIEAEPNQQIKIQILEMDIETNCTNDRLEIGEGHEGHINPIHIYCDTFDELPDIFETITSKSRFVTLNWITNEKIEKTGWKLEYKIVNDNDDCNFHEKAMFGVIKSPNFGGIDYLANQNCRWDIQVPTGYHINLHFKYFDIEPSENCIKDNLTITEITKEKSDNEVDQIRCGNANSSNFNYEFESPRLLLNFNSDNQTEGRGFEIEWEAKCGAVHTSNQGIITSPNYPNGYPNEDQICEYIIDAPIDFLVHIEIHDFLIESCHYEDEVKVIEMKSKKIIKEMCGRMSDVEPIRDIEGPVKILFRVKKTYPPISSKTLRGFKMNYTVKPALDVDI
ncbi:unnamed protein product [Caenorhabditis angaria]|uniref:Uncharacterized protein n=1 Tax=Caenorhabditis angaria TaxID=860376 RepID=A0A9P1J000_9PELO|nr:unnamed protein product [Caenorhabditis angaria]